MTNNAPHISVIMPARNSARTLGAAIDSVLNQSLKGLELIVCDDASMDETTSVLSSYTDPRLKTIKNSEKLGAGGARDAAIAQARGTWLAFIDADDAWLPNRLETLLSAAGSRKDVMIFDDLLMCHDAPAGLVPWRRVRGKSAFGASQNSAVEVVFADYIRQQYLLMQPMFPASLVRGLKLRHSHRKYAEDTEYVLRLVEAGTKLIYVPKAMYLYRTTSGSLTANRQRSEMMMEVLVQAGDRMSLDKSEREAFRKKIAQVAQDIRYTPFLWSLKDRRVFASLWMLVRRPVLLWEFLKRLGVSVAYNLHRLRHRAEGR